MAIRTGASQPRASSATRTGEGPIFGVRGKGEFCIGIGNFRELQKSGFENYTPDAKIVVAPARAGQKAMYRLNGDPGKDHAWRHLAIATARRHGVQVVLLVPPVSSVLVADSLRAAASRIVVLHPEDFETLCHVVTDTRRGADRG